MRDIRLFLFAIALPALLVAAGGIRLLSVEADRARGAAREALRLRTVALAADIERAAAEKAQLALAPLASTADAPTRRFEANRIAQENPDIVEVRLFPRGEGGPARSSRSMRRSPPFEGPHGVEGPRRARVPFGPEPFLVFDTRLPSGDICRLSFSREAAASVLAAVADSDDRIRPTCLELVTIAGHRIVAHGASAANTRGSIAPVPRSNASLVTYWPSGAASHGEASRLLLLGGCLLALLVASLVAGGWLLVRAARRERLDALRKTDFVDNVSHELKTPLAGIRLSAELLAEGRVPEGPRRDKALHSILSESDRLERLVSNLLDFGRLERGRRQFARERVDLAALIAEMQNAQCTMDKEEETASGIVHCALCIVHCEHGVTALADADAVRQILVNLFDNAAKYAAAGGPPEVSVRGAGNGVVEVAVADRGPGIPRGLEEKVFERFFRADDSMTRRSNGSGLGLSIARGLARGMGGDLVCRARAGGGAEFILTLPGGE